MIGDLWQDIRFGLRTLRRHPGFALAATLSLALGIGANTAIFSLVNALMLRSLPVRDPQGLVLFSDGLFAGTGDRPEPGRLNAYSYPLYQRLRAQNQAFEDLAAQDSAATTAVILEPGVHETESSAPAIGRLVTANYFRVLGVPAYRGRTFLPEDETAPGANPVIVLSHDYWQRRFGGKTSLIGNRLEANGRQYTVLGVTPPGFGGLDVGNSADFWAPVTMQAELSLSRSQLGPTWWWLMVVGRSKPGVSMGSAEASVNVTFRQFIGEDQRLLRIMSGRPPTRIGLESGATGVSRLRRTFREPLLALMVGVGVLLLIVCLNVSHLLMARAVARQREMTIRTALGATRSRLIRQLLSEGFLLAVIGAVGGAIIAHFMAGALVALAQTGGTPLTLDLGTDARVLSFLAALAVLTAVLLGLVPALQASRTQVQEALRATSQTVTAGGSRKLVGRLLLTSQVAASLVLLIGAGLLAVSLGKLRNVEKGFDEDHVLLVRMLARPSGLTQEQALALYDELPRRVAALPGVRGASLSLSGLLSAGGTPNMAVFLPGTTSLTGVQVDVVTPGYFETVGMRLTAGRGLAREDGANAMPVVVVNETLARRFYGATAAPGQLLRFDFAAPKHPVDVAVVGVVKDARTEGLRRDPRPTAYLAAAQGPAVLGRTYLASLEVRTLGDPLLLAGSVRQAIADSRPTLPVLGVRTMHSHVDKMLMRERFLATLSTAFGLAALFLICVGLYGVISHWATQRTREMAVRMALGATPGRVRAMVLREACKVVLVGLALGLPAALAASHLLDSFLFGLRPTDPLTLVAASAALLLVSATAAYLPALRASRVHPMAALRSD